jgi:DNA-binding XRE family transcriptional regulator
MNEPSGRMHIPLKEAFAEWMKDPEFVKSYEADEGKWNLIWAFADARGNMTQEELAKAMGTTQTAVSRMESGRGNPSFKTMERFAKATNTRLVIRFEPIQKKAQKP